MKKVLIIGAGPAGLTAAYELLKTGEYDVTVLERSQEIGDAASFLGFDGILMPSARWPCQNLVLFVDRLNPEDLTVRDSEPVDWQAWRARSAKQVG